MELKKMSPLSFARYFKKNRRDIDDQTLNHFLDNSQQFPHIPSKEEGHLLRRLMSKTGLNETQIREIPAYRKQLSACQHKQSHSYFSAKNRNLRFLKNFFKDITQTTGLTIEHPTSLALAREKLSGLKNNYYSSRYDLRTYLTVDLNNISDVSIISLYRSFSR